MALITNGFHSLKSLCSRRENWRLKLKLIRAWNMCALATPNVPYAMKLLFVDEEGEKTEAVVQKQYMHRFANHVVEGQVYKVTNFTVNRNGGNFRAAGHDYKLGFNASTRVVLCENAIIPFLGLSLVKSNEIRDTKGFSNNLFDFMGIVISVSEELSIIRDQGDTRLTLVDLVDEMGQIRCALFGDLVDTMNGLLALPRVGLPVMIIQLARVNLYKGEVGIQNLMNTSKILWNPPIPEAISFKDSLAVHEIESDVAISIISEKDRPVSLRDQFLKLYPKKTVGELIHLLEDGNFIVLGTIIEVLQSDHWWYLGCSTCMRVVNFDVKPPYCDECQVEVYDISPRYKVKVVVSDGIESASLIMFDSECSYLLKRQCKDLVAQKKGKNKDAYPDEILSLVGMELLFRIERKEDYFFLYDECYTVRKICTDSSLMNEFKEILDDGTPLKLKFAPAFSNLEQAEGKSRVIDLSPQCNSVASEVHPTPPSSDKCSSSVPSMIVCSKRGPTDDDDPPSEKKKRTNFRGPKVERG